LFGAEDDGQVVGVLGDQLEPAAQDGSTLLGGLLLPGGAGGPGPPAGGERPPSGRRRCDAASVRRLVFLTRMRTSGMPIRDLRRYIELVEAGRDTVPERLALLTEHRDELRARIDELRLALAATEYKIATYTRELEGQASPNNTNISSTDKEIPS